MNRSPYWYPDNRGRRPVVETIDNCTLEIDTGRGNIKVHKDGKILVWVKRIPISFLKGKATIELTSSSSLLDDKEIK
jgi:hypothetical protein